MATLRSPADSNLPLTVISLSMQEQAEEKSASWVNEATDEVVLVRRETNGGLFPPSSPAASEPTVAGGAHARTQWVRQGHGVYHNHSQGIAEKTRLIHSSRTAIADRSVLHLVSRVTVEPSTPTDLALDSASGPEHLHARNRTVSELLEKARNEPNRERQYRFQTLAGVIISSASGAQRRIRNGLEARGRFVDRGNEVLDTYDGAVPRGGYGGGRRSVYSTSNASVLPRDRQPDYDAKDLPFLNIPEGIAQALELGATIQLVGMEDNGVRHRLCTNGPPEPPDKVDGVNRRSDLSAPTMTSMPYLRLWIAQ